MTEEQQIKVVLGFDDQQMEERIMEDWLRWCENKSYSNQYSIPTQNGHVIFAERDDKDLQNLVADNSLFKFWLDAYLDCLLDFLDHVTDMKPLPSPEEALQILNRSVVDTHRLFSKRLLNHARSKKIVEYVGS
ncbi:hypothetical protein [Flagellimonas eckloniae]|uniref:Uncharacterized protein n=1 Tax=Flagellimonas eckloniae TaxID=346185 RepID=A0A0Q1BZF9_9FLAO|nr:hypothetical protein [Allomuricauda eckloniae]KQC30204.1 hypothetical protein AAY42_10180 [Allomuricauda eckloniae]